MLLAGALALVLLQTAAADTPLQAAVRSARSVPWADALPAIEVVSEATGEHDTIRLYGSNGEVDDDALARFDQIAARGGEVHDLEPRVVQLVFKAAYHFKSPRISIVSAWRDNAGRHTSGDAVDFKLQHVRASQLAAWCRSLPRAGVGIYTHPRTQYVHLDTRDQSYHWLDASPPGVKWREKQLRDPGQVKRDAAWSPDQDLPL
ncbi:MAG TPA: hypothetical protein VF765_37800 [Polyangiaceae bacterium]